MNTSPEWPGAAPISVGAVPAPPPVPRSESVDRPEFTGSWQEYFGIWIVNLALTILTLGIYTPWARVRTRRYFYQNTWLFREPFDYLADPRKILVGFLILVVLYASYMLLEYLHTWLSLVVLILFFGILPWLVYKSFRFFAANSAWRNVTLRFHGRLGGAYAAYLLLPLLGMLTFGLLYPYAVFKQREYFFGNLSYGQLRGRFIGTGTDVFIIYVTSFLAALAAAIGVGVLGYLVSTALVPNDPTGRTRASFMVVLVMLLVYLGMGLGVLILRARMHNYCWNGFFFGHRIRFRSRLGIARFCWISLSNLLVCLCTLFLMFPWAKVRMYTYRLSCLEVYSRADLDQVVATAQEDVNAIGDSAAELFDLDFGF